MITNPIQRILQQVYQRRLLHTSACLFRKTKTRKQKVDAITFKKEKRPKILVWHNMSISELAINAETDENILMNICATKLQRKASIDDHLATDEMITLVRHLGYAPQFTHKPEEENDEYELQRSPPPDPSQCTPRPPVVTIMGHVDHGKTTLLDRLRASDIVAHEHGGITQHIGAFTVNLSSFVPTSAANLYNKITFIDTPGHAAFAQMRQRGANCTDIIVLVVAADDGVQEQTVESLNFARQAQVPIIVAINKIDREISDIPRTRQMLQDIGVELDDVGGDTQVVEISALKSLNLDKLCEAIVTQAELMQLKGDAKGKVEGVVIECKETAGFGHVATVLVQSGTLKKGDILVAGQAYCRARLLHFGEETNISMLKECTLSDAIEVAGWRGCAPIVGDEVLQASSEDIAKMVAEKRRLETIKSNAVQATEVNEKVRQELIDKTQTLRDERLAAGRLRGVLRLNIEEVQRMRNQTIKKFDASIPIQSIIMKVDVAGSLEVLENLILDYDCNDQCQLDLVKAEVGNLTEEDVQAAAEWNASIYLFNIEASKNMLAYCNQMNVPLYSFKVIYHLVDSLKHEITKRLLPKPTDFLLGSGKVIAVFDIKFGRKTMPVPGVKVIGGNIKLENKFRIKRGDKILFDGSINNMRIEKADVKEAFTNDEVGLMIKSSYDETIAALKFQIGDMVECYETRDVEQTTKWQPKGF